MSIIDTFDCYGEEIIKAKNNFRAIDNFPTTMIVVFSARFRELFLNEDIVATWQGRIDNFLDKKVFSKMKKSRHFTKIFTKFG